MPYQQLPDNLLIIDDGLDNSVLRAYDNLHFTNGVFSAPPEVIVPTVLSGFKFVSDYAASPGDAFVIAVNSDISMNGIMDKKGASAEERAALESQNERALKVAVPVALLNPGHPVVVIFYDEETPTALYDSLTEDGLPLMTLHKWGYGTKPDAPRIEGSHNFGQVLAFPLPNDRKPVCHDITIAEDQSGIVQIFKLTEVEGSHGRPYLSEGGKVLFPVPESLATYAETAGAPQNKPAPSAPSGP